MKSLYILIVTTRLPYPPTDGGRIAIFEPIRHLAQRGHHITLLTFGSRDIGDWTPLEKYCRLELVEHDTANHVLAAALNLFSSVPYTISKYNSNALALRMRQLLALDSYDLVQIEHLHMSHYLSIAREYDIPSLLRQHNVESVIAERFWQEARGLSRLYVGTQLAKLRHFEANTCEQADVCLTITDVDAQRLQEMHPRINAIVVPAGVDIERYAPSPELEEECEIVFVGSMNWLPNADAVLWFGNEIFPMVKREIPNAKFYIVGKNPSESVQRLAHREDVIVTGFVQDVREYVARASVFVVPLRIGSGMRLKILEAMAMGKAVVSTSVGAEGIDVADGQDIVLSDTVDDFSQAVIELLRNKDKRDGLGYNARRLVEECYDWDTVVDIMEQVYQEVVEDRESQ